MKYKDFNEWVKFARNLETYDIIRLIKDTPTKYKGIVTCALTVARHVGRLHNKFRCPLCVCTNDYSCSRCLVTKHFGQSCTGMVGNLNSKQITNKTIELYIKEYREIFGE